MQTELASMRYYNFTTTTTTTTTTTMASLYTGLNMSTMPLVKNCHMIFLNLSLANHGFGTSRLNMQKPIWICKCSTWICNSVIHVVRLSRHPHVNRLPTTPELHWPSGDRQCCARSSWTEGDGCCTMKSRRRCQLNWTARQSPADWADSCCLPRQHKIHVNIIKHNK